MLTSDETMNFPKSLIIGLGGIGSEIVAKVYQRFINCNPTENERNIVGFICFDTDSQDIESRRKIMPKEFVVKTSAEKNVTVGGYLDLIKDKSAVEEWFDITHRHLLELTLNDGAGQIRMASRLALSLAIEEGKLDIIRNVINRILKVQAGQIGGNDIRVHIVSSMAGGTGAGSFMQVSYLVKEILKSNGLERPRITGYFLLADVLCQDPSTQFDEQKKENTRANCYASIKELNGIYNYEKTTNSFNIDFEYRFFTDEEQGRSLPDFEPFEVSYLYDYEDANGGNRGKKENYYDQMEDYLYLNLFSPIGAKTRSAAVNDILANIKSGGLDRYASTGVSKIEYPVNDIFNYFSIQRVADNLQTSWLKIDNEYVKLLGEHKRQLKLGVITEKPDLHRFFMDQVEHLAKNGEGLTKAVFSNIYQSTQIFDKNGTQKGVKSQVFVRELMAYLSKAKDGKRSISDITNNLVLPADFVSQNREDTDLQHIQIFEINLKQLRKEVISFVDNTKSLGIEEGFIADYSEAGFLSNSISRVNTYILKNDEVMHPIAIRYFLYDLNKQLRLLISSLKDENEKNLAFIEEYSNYFDIRDDAQKDDHIETAAEAYEIYLREDAKLIKRFAKLFGKGSLQEFKEKYVTRSRRQVSLLNNYALTKLQEEVAKGLHGHINLMIEEVETMFRNLSGIQTGLMRKAAGSLKMHESNSNKSTQFVLGKASHKEHIYRELITLSDDIDFPQDLSRLLYEGLYKNVHQKITKKSISNTSIRSISELFETDVIDKQTESLLNEYDQNIAGYSVIEAMRYEASLEGKDEKEHLKNYFTEAVKLANPLGASNITGHSHLNSWALNPVCLLPDQLSEDDADELLGSVGSSGAYRVESNFFPKNEIIREDSTFLLTVPKNYPKFAASALGKKYSTVTLGEYYKAYNSRIKDVTNNESVSPHLDKRWHFPGYFPNIGETREVVDEKIYRAFFWGLINQDIYPRIESGDKQWVFLRSSSNTTRVIQDENQKVVKLTIPNLIDKGLYANPGIVDSILERAMVLLEEEKQAFEEKFVSSKTDALLNLPVFKKMKEFSLDVGAFPKKDTFLDLLIKSTHKDKDRVINVVMQSIVEAVFFIGGKNTDSKKAAKNLIADLLTVNTSKEYISKFENLLKTE